MQNTNQQTAKHTYQHQRAFTLLEVLIALTILAISSIAVITQTGQSLRQQEQLELKTLALWIAENQINSYQISELWPNTGQQRQAITAANQPWIINTQISRTSDPWLRKIEISVKLDKGTQSNTLVHLTAYRGRY